MDIMWDLITEYGEDYIAKVQRYYCSDCSKYSKLNFTNQQGNYYNFSNETKE